VDAPTLHTSPITERVTHRPMPMARALCLVLAAALAACGGARGTVVEIDDLRARTPATWSESGPVQPPRIRRFVLPGGLEDDAELSIFHYGRGYGGDIQTSIERWKGSFELPPGEATGRTIDDFTTVRTYRTPSVRVTIVDVRGTYLHRDRPLDVRADPERRRAHRLIGVVFESRHGPYFLRLVGPERTVDRHEQAFLRWLRAFR
jgi:hypothetical protein